jgi:hypothetical protein
MERISKRVLNGNIHTTRPVVRPRTRWADVVQRDAFSDSFFFLIACCNGYSYNYWG